MSRLEEPAVGVAVDQEVIATLRNAGVPTEIGQELPPIPIAMDEKGSPVVIGDDVPVHAPDGRVITVKLRPVSALFTGNTVPPSFSDGPTPEYVYFFLLMEQTAANFCVTTKRVERDTEFEAVYNHLRRRPDGKHANPIYSYLRAAARLYMSLADVSQAEYEGVVDRLRKSAKHFALNATTSNYYQLIKNQFGLSDGKETPWPIRDMV